MAQTNITYAESCKRFIVYECTSDVPRSFVSDFVPVYEWCNIICAILLMLKFVRVLLLISASEIIFVPSLPMLLLSKDFISQAVLISSDVSALLF